MDTRCNAFSIPLECNGTLVALQRVSKCNAKSHKIRTNGILIAPKEDYRLISTGIFSCSQTFFSSGNDIEDTLFFVTLHYNTTPLSVNIYYFRFGNPESPHPLFTTSHILYLFLITEQPTICGQAAKIHIASYKRENATAYVLSDRKGAL